MLKKMVFRAAGRAVASLMQKCRRKSVHYRPITLNRSDPYLLESATRQWHVGDWTSLARIELDVLIVHSERRQIALLVAAALLQLGRESEGRQYIGYARQWGCTSTQLTRILLSGAYNTLGRLVALNGNSHLAQRHFRDAIELAVPVGENNLLTKPRTREQVDQLNAFQLSFSKPQANETTRSDTFSRLDVRALHGLKQCRSEYLSINGREAQLNRLNYGDKFIEIYSRKGSEGDDGAIRQIFVDKEYEFSWLPQGKAVYSEYERIVRLGKSPLIIDAGGNIGAASIWFQNKFPRSFIFAIEPETSNADLFEINCSNMNVTLFVGAVADRSRELYLSDPGQGDWGYRVGREGETKVNCIGIEEILHEYNEACGYLPLILKVDVEGAEAFVFDGPCNWLEKIPMVIIELHDWMLPHQGTSKNFLISITRHNFDVIARGENLLCFNRSLLSSNGETEL